MYFSKFTRKQRKKKSIKSQQQTARKQRKKKSIKSQQQTARKQRKKKSIKSFLLPKRSNKTESKSATESTIESIISNITQKNISADEKIQMICDELSQLKTIAFYGVLTLPYIKSTGSKDTIDRGKTIGGMIRNRHETNADRIVRLEKELQAIDKKIGTTESSRDNYKKKAKDAEAEAATAAAEALVASAKTKGTLQDKAKQKKLKQRQYEENVGKDVITLKELEKRKQELSDTIEAAALEQAETRRQQEEAMAHVRIVEAEVAMSTRCLERHRAEYDEINDLLQQIEVEKNRFIQQISAIDLLFEPMTGSIIRSITTKLDDINKINYNRRLSDYKIARQGLPQYQDLVRNLDTSITVVNRYKAQIQGLPRVIAPIGIREFIRIDLICDNQFIITDADCDRVYLLVQNNTITKDSGRNILDVWLKNTTRMIELEKELFSKGYKGLAYLTDYIEYKEEFEKIKSDILTDRLNTALENSPRIRGEHIIVKSKQLAVTGVAWFFYSNSDEAEAIRLASEHQPRNNFHFTAHLDPGDVAVGSDLPSRNINRYSSGSLHLRGNTNIYKANMRPYIFKEDTDSPPIDGFVGLPHCIQVIPVYPGDATETSEVIYVGRIVTDTLNTYLQELAIDSQKPIKEQEHNDNFRQNTRVPIITELQKELPKQIKLVKKQRYLANIQRFQETLAPITAAILVPMAVVGADADCKKTIKNLDELYKQTIATKDSEIKKKRDKFIIDEMGMDRSILVEIARQGINLKDVDILPAEIFPEGGHLDINDIEAEAARVEPAIARGKYTRKRLNKVSKKRRYKISRKRTNKLTIYKIKTKINKKNKNK
jgi:hypothetical protein